MIRLLMRCSFILLAASVWIHASARADAADADISARELIENVQRAETIDSSADEANKEKPPGSTPLSAMIRLRDAMRAKDWEAAGEFLDRRYMAQQLENYSDEQLVRALAFVWNQQNILNVADLSDEPEGNLSDGLPHYRDLIGTISLRNEDIPVYLQRVPDGKGSRVWKLSNATVARIPDMWAELGYSPLAISLGKWLPDFRFLGMENWQIVGLCLSFLVAWPLAMLASYLLMRLALLIPNRFPLGVQRFFRWPIRVFLFIIIGRSLIEQLGLSMTARVLLNSSGIDYLAVTVLLLGIMNLLRDHQTRKMQHAGNAQYVALLRPMTTVLKVLLVTIVALVWAQRAGYDMSTILAGLGVGSLAVALAAQKTLENIIGTITLYTARPVSVGDFCRFGTVTGVVEEIGLRSTQIRTLERSMVIIPNAVFAAQEIENISQRDRIRYFRKFHLSLPASADLRSILNETRQLLQANAQVLDNTISVRFVDIQDGNAILRIDAGIDTGDYQVFLAEAENLNLGILEIAEQFGAHFTGPGRLLQSTGPTGA